MTPAFACFALQLQTSQGYPLAAGGICRAPTAAMWEEKLASLAHLYLPQTDIYQIDYGLAKALERLGSESLVAVGATLWAKDRIFPAGVRTGGVIGRPGSSIASAAADCEELPDGFAEYALPGGPGLVAQGPKDVVEQALEQILAEASHGLGEAALLRILRAKGLETGLLVFDGTGQGAPGCLLAFAAGQSRWVSLKGDQDEESGR